MRTGQLQEFGTGVQIVSQRLGGVVADTTALAAVPVRERTHMMWMGAWNSGNAELYYFDSAAVSGDVEPDAGSGYWKRYSPDAVEPGTVTPSSISWTLDPETGSTAVVLDHADSSPKELLAADATFDRVVRVHAYATEAAAGEPDIDVGSATTDPNGIVDDAFAGAWVVGDSFEGMIRLPAGEALVATIGAAGTAGAFLVYVDAVPIPRQVVEAVAGQDETSDTTIPVTGLAAGDRLVAVTVFASGVPTTRALADFTVGAAELTVVGNAANNSANKYLIQYEDRT